MGVSKSWSRAAFDRLAHTWICKVSIRLATNFKLNFTIYCSSNSVTIMTSVFSLFFIFNRRCCRRRRSQVRERQDIWCSTRDLLTREQALEIARRLAKCLKLSICLSIRAIYRVAFVASIMQHCRKIHWASVKRTCNLSAMCHCRSFVATIHGDTCLLTLYFTNVIATGADTSVIANKVYACSNTTILPFAVICISTHLLAVVFCAHRVAEIAIACVCWGWSNQVNASTFRAASVSLAIIDVSAAHLLNR
mmetsp:Transcript_27081/g.43374  ORF Transcript_27081/g.43374 Transcript_27081/m.43374 type:complete len:250 (-) Transcript_27081:3153-3902(-)